MLCPWQEAIFMVPCIISTSVHRKVLLQNKETTFMDVEKVSLILQSHFLDGVMGALSSILVLYPSLIHLYVYDRFTRVL